MNIPGITLETPDFIYRDFAYDLMGIQNEDAEVIMAVALPLIGLYKRASFPLSVAMNSLRTYGFAVILEDISAKNAALKVKSLMLFHLLFSGAALAGTLIAHPLGMLISTTQELANEILLGYSYWKGTEKNPDLPAYCFTVINHGLYFALFFSRRTELKVASLGMQAISHLYNILSHFREKKLTSACILSAFELPLLATRVIQLREPIKLLNLGINFQRA